MWCTSLLALGLVGVTSAFFPSCAPALAPCAARSPARIHASPSKAGAGKLRMVAAVPDSKTTYDRAAWMRGWQSPEKEIDAYTVPTQCIKGQVPQDLIGTYYRNGPALFELGENKLSHPLDGDGMVAAWTFSGDGTLKFRSRFVRTDAHVKEQNALKKGYKGPPITKAFFSGGKGEPKNCANTGVVYWGNRLLALYETALPVELDPAGLHAVGETRIMKSLPAKSSFTARPKYDPASDRLVGMRYSPLAANAEVQFFEYDDSWQCATKSSIRLKGHAIVHDFGVTRKHYIVHQAPSTLNSLALSLGLQPPMSCISYDTSKSGTFHILARDGGEARVVASPGSGFILHIANAFEDKQSGAIVLDAIEMPRLPIGAVAASGGSWRETFEFARDVPPAQLVRWTIPSSATQGAASRVVLDNAFQAFPEVNPFVKTVAHTFVYTAGGGQGEQIAPLQCVRKFDVRKGAVVTEYCMGPAEFVGNSEDDGYLLVTVLDGGKDGQPPRTRLDVFDAIAVNKGPVCSVALESYLPHTLYGCWAVGVVPKDEDYAKGSLRAAMNEKNWGALGSGMSLIGVSNFAD